LNEALARSIRRYAELPDAEIEAFERALVPRTCSAGERFRSDGPKGARIAFVERGLFRLYYVDEEGAEATRAFVAEGGFLASREAIFRGRPTSFIMEALEDSRLLVLERGGGKLAAAPVAAWAPFFIGMMEERLDAKDRRIEGFLMGDATTRYLEFLEDFPGLEGRIKQHHIASYLGVTPVTLSRIRRSLRSGS